MLVQPQSCSRSRTSQLSTALQSQKNFPLEFLGQQCCHNHGHAKTNGANARHLPGGHWIETEPPRGIKFIVYGASGITCSCIIGGILSTALGLNTPQLNPPFATTHVSDKQRRFRVQVPVSLHCVLYSELVLKIGGSPNVGTRDKGAAPHWDAGINTGLFLASRWRSHTATGARGERSRGADRAARVVAPVEQP
eukprot:631269-Rhodomonas_salina.2